MWDHIVGHEIGSFQGLISYGKHDLEIQILVKLLAPKGDLYFTPPGYHPIQSIPSTYSLRCDILLRRHYLFFITQNEESQRQ